MKSLSRSTSARVLAGLPFFLVGLFLIALTTADLSAKARSRKASGQHIASVTPAASVPVAFMGTYNPTVFPCLTQLNCPFNAHPQDVIIISMVSATNQNYILHVIL